jgi:hypothetical protein
MADFSSSGGGIDLGPYADVKQSRELDTVYQADEMLLVGVTASEYQFDGTITVRMKVDGTDVALFSSTSNTTSNSFVRAGGMIMVPAGSTYEAATSDDASAGMVDRWAEASLA